MTAIQGLKFTVIIPTYNEGENLALLAHQLFRVFYEHKLQGSILVIDDSSPDGTGELAEEISRTHPNFRVVHRARKTGIGSAYRVGFKRALDEGCKVVFEMDSDLSHDPIFIPQFLQAINDGWDVVIGSRYVPHSKIVGWNWRRISMSKTANFLARYLAGLKVHDATSGYRAIRASSLRKVDVDRIESNGYAFQIELLFELEKITNKIHEVPTIFVNRRRGRSKLRTGDVIGFAWTNFKLWMGRILS